jgi:mannose-6-phosphate isomerase-like protein (cupin superfamily)
MKKTSLTNFDAPTVVHNDQFNIRSDDYLDDLTLNKIVVLPLRRLQGNVESKTGKDTTIMVIAGSGSMEVNGSSVPISVGDVLCIKSNEIYTVINDSLEAVLQFVSVYTKN